MESKPVKEPIPPPKIPKHYKYKNIKTEFEHMKTISLS